MTEDGIRKYVAEHFAGVDTVVADAGTFFIYDPQRDLPDNKRWPFATIVDCDNDFDNRSNLDRENVFRLNIGVSKETLQSMFGTLSLAADGSVEGYDFARLDALMPHPMYGRMHWLCVLNPSDATFEKILALLDEAYQISVRRVSKASPGDAQE